MTADENKQTDENPRERREIALDKATFKDMKAFAESDMGIPIANGTNLNQIRAKLKEAGWENDFILGPEPIVEPVKPVVPPPRAAAAAPQDDGEIPPEVPEPMFEIEVSETVGAGGKRPYFVGVNGVGIMLPRNKKIMVKRRYIEALKSAQEDQNTLNEETGEMEARRIYAVPFQVHTPPSKEEIAAWLLWEAHSEKAERASARANEARLRRELAKDAA